MDRVGRPGPPGPPGRGLARPGQTYRSTPRQVWGKPMSADWRTGLRAGAGHDHE